MPNAMARRSQWNFAACSFMSFLFTSLAAAEVPEPQTYWMGAMHGEVPPTLAGAKVLHTQELAAFLAEAHPILIDAASFPRKPANLDPATVWKPMPHENIPGSVWIPGIGEGQIETNVETYFRERLAVLTGHSLDQPIVFYCHPQCWASWNAAKRALSYDYRHIYWYPDGAEGWQDAGNSLTVARPETVPDVAAEQYLKGDLEKK